MSLLKKNVKTAITGVCKRVKENVLGRLVASLGDGAVVTVSGTFT